MSQDKEQSKSFKGRLAAAPGAHRLKRSKEASPTNGDEKHLACSTATRLALNSNYDLNQSPTNE